MIEELLPATVASAEVCGDVVEPALSEVEERAVANAIEARRLEFITGRACAKLALMRLGVRPEPIEKGPSGAPNWPVGIVGSITHCKGYRASAVARARHVRSIGIDAEPDEPLPEGILNLVATRMEREGLPSDLHGCWDRLLFSAKEAVYKACFPLTGRWMDFHDASIGFSRTTQTFQASLRRRLMGGDGSEIHYLTGRWMRGRGLILTAVVVARTDSIRASPEGEA